MKLGVLYSVWNGLELLSGSINQIINDVDHIVICYQKVSNKGETNPTIIDDIYEIINGFDSTKFIIIGFEPNLIVNTKQNETNKHNKMIDTARKSGCTHFLFAACDHYYDTAQFKRAKTFCEQNKYSHTFTEMITYYKHDTWALWPLEDYYAPFICELGPDTKIDMAAPYPLRNDPATKIKPIKKYMIFSMDNIIMHHYSMIRKDIENKFRNAAASIRWTPEQIEQFTKEYKYASLGDRIFYFQGRQLVLSETILKENPILR